MVNNLFYLLLCTLSIPGLAHGVNHNYHSIATCTNTHVSVAKFVPQNKGHAAEIFSSHPAESMTNDDSFSLVYI